jgi:hypothetical protein
MTTLETCSSSSSRQDIGCREDILTQGPMLDLVVEQMQCETKQQAHLGASFCTNVKVALPNFALPNYDPDENKST